MNNEHIPSFQGEPGAIHADSNCRYTTDLPLRLRNLMSFFGVYLYLLMVLMEREHRARHGVWTLDVRMCD